jgi:uncharacterized protein (TIGR02001 family)
MRTTLSGLTILAAAAAAAPAFAQDAPASDWTISGGAAVTSDYRFRGVSQTDKAFAVQGTIGISHASGFYVGTWGSSIDDYVAAGSDQEIDIYAGYKKTFDGTTVDGGLLYYYYPGAGGADTDFFEPYLNVSHAFGPVTGKVGLNYAWSQAGLACGLPTCHGNEQNLYTYGELSAGIPDTGFTVTGHLGESWGRSYLTAGLKNYTDWSVTAAYTVKALTFSVTYVDTDFKRSEGAIAGVGDPTKGGVTAAVSIAF